MALLPVLLVAVLAANAGAAFGARAQDSGSANLIAVRYINQSEYCCDPAEPSPVAEYEPESHYVSGYLICLILLILVAVLFYLIGRSSAPTPPTTAQVDAAVAAAFAEQVRLAGPVAPAPIVLLALSQAEPAVRRALRGIGL